MKLTSALTALTAFAALLLLPALAHGDGLLYQVPKDGSWVRYDLKMVGDRGGQQQTAKGSLMMAVTGTVTENDMKCRWIEFKFELTEPGGNRTETVLAKVLIPEKHLAKGADPVPNRVRGWLKQNAEGDAKLMSNDELGPMPAFLAKPLTDAKKLDKKELDTKLGKLECEGMTGISKFAEGPGEATIEHEVRLHEKAPFGVVESSMKFSSVRNGQVRERGTMTFTLAETGDDAKSVLPDQK